MTPQELKNSILQQAIQGKLVEQRPEEGTAEELFQQIQEEKLGELIRVIGGVSYKKNDVSTNGLRILRGGNIKNTKVYLNEDDVFLPLSYEDSEKQVRKDDIIIVASTGSKTVIGKAGFIESDIPNTMIGAFLRICRPYFFYIVDYIKCIFNSEYYRNHIRIEELLPYIHRYEESWRKLEALNSRFPSDMKKSLLQYAIQGKLVEQRPEEGTAEELFQQIQEEKQRLIAEGKIKKEKPLPEITEEEKPFDIPESWKWVRFGDLGSYKKGPFGSALTKSMFVPKGNGAIKVYEQKNAIQKNACIGDYYITREYFDTKMTGFEVLPSDIIVSCAGTIGETYVLPENIEQGIINQALMRMRIFSPIFVPYFLVYFDVMLKQNAIAGSKGSAIKNIPPFEVLKNYLVPLPPLAEQKRIVAKLEQLLPLCERLK